VPYSPVPELNDLKELQDRFGWERLSDGFGLSDWGERGGLDTWSADEAFVSRFLTFAQANGTGSIYAFWRVDDRTDLASLPVVVFGDEGGQHVVASDLRDLLRLLAYDTEVMVDWADAYYYREPDQRTSRNHDQYVAWLADRFGLTPPDDPDPIVEAARARYGEAFRAFCARFFDPDGN
jgi:hypothetical protein